jgi:BirA family biotin operon repressor/biotin-[acetyl-CoA-carboxylase] ligase
MENLSAEAFTHKLATSLIGRRVLYFPRLTSTMDTAREEAQAWGAEGTVIVADEQTAGRGRLKRTWFAPTGNIAMSVILCPQLSELPSLMMLASLAVVHSIESVTGIKAQIKWPNDVLINGKKVCGILIETNVEKEQVGYAILGIGINVSLRAADIAEIESTATSLAAEAGKEISRLTLTRDILSQLDRLYLVLRQGHSPYEEWRDELVTLGQRVRVKSGEGVQDGVAESVDRDGSLMLRTPDGKLTRVIAGDVTLRV